ncbi:MAG: hypothetical protein JJU00_15225 [Opitutales bacterium]|nr:hypothetical protein [Opitutales bacterium]
MQVAPSRLRPTALYINWASYDELSDAVELTEERALAQLDALLALRMRGVRFDGYLMDCFWYARDGGYRAWRKPHWPDGPDRWLDRCHEAGLQPGLWFACNNLERHCQIDPHPAWEDSLGQTGLACALFTGGFLGHWLETMSMYYERGFRFFKLDFVNLNAAPREAHARWLPSEIRAMNAQALRDGLRRFRAEHPGAYFLAYNGFEECETDTPNHTAKQTMCGTGADLPKIIDTAWLDVFDSIYCGDPRLADVPCRNFWRSKDIYSNHMVRVYEANGIPLSRIDNSGFMIGDTGTCYFRRKKAWKAMFVLAHARGGWMNTYYGDLSLLDENDAVWMTRVQDLYLPLQGEGEWSTFGGVPGRAEPHGFAAATKDGAVYTVTNPSQGAARIPLPGGGAGDARILFHDNGAPPETAEGVVRLGPEAVAVVGTGRFAADEWDLGTEPDVEIAREEDPWPLLILRNEDRCLHAETQPPPPGRDLLIVFQQHRAWGDPVRTTGGWPPDGLPMDKVIRLSVTQGGKPVALSRQYDKTIWSGLSWAAVVVRGGDCRTGLPLKLEAATPERDAERLDFKVYAFRRD